MGRRKYHLPNHETMVDNILKIYREADDDAKTQGRLWYDAAHSEALNMAQKHSTDVRTAAGVISALSPANAWERNLIDADNLLDIGEDATVATYGQNKAKALKIAETRNVSEHIGNGEKTRNFWLCIADPTRDDVVTVDRHAIKIATGGEDIPITSLRYKKIAAAYRDAAEVVGELPMDIQAITWVVWRDNYAGRNGDGFKRRPRAA